VYLTVSREAAAVLFTLGRMLSFPTSKSEDPHDKLIESAFPNFFPLISSPIVFRPSLTVLFLASFPILNISRANVIHLLEHGKNCVALDMTFPPCCSYRPSTFVT
jgi:hypothetical protein